MAKNIELKVYSQEGAEVSTISLNKEVFGIEPNEAVMFDAVQVYRSNSRQATAKTKKRKEVSGSTRKPFRQKGTGRARAGGVRSPIWVGGGTVFGPNGEQNYKIRQNKKEYNLALRSAYSKLVKDIVVLDSLKVKGKTKDIIKVLTALKVNDKKVILVSDNELVWQGSNNLQGVANRTYDNLSVYDLLNCDKLVITKEDIKKIEEALA